MLTRSFIHIPTVGPTRERAIWRAGVSTWDDFLARGEALLPRRTWNLGRPVIQASIAALNAGDWATLGELLPQREHWRALGRLERVAYLDIETGGDPEDWGGLTVVGVYGAAGMIQQVARRDMEEAVHCLRGYDAVVTFGGASFDLPYLQRVLPDIYIPPIRVDLRHTLRRVGLSGGLKRIERQVGLARPDEVDGLDGWGAVQLWRAHCQGEDGALDLLLGYNAQDCINLEPLARLACERLTRVTFDR